MAFTLVTDLSGEQSNSYVDITYADDYWNNHFNAMKISQWAALSAGAKANLLVQACKVIETARFTEPIDFFTPYHLMIDPVTGQIRSVKRLMDRPQRLNFYQRLQFPRTDTVYWASGGAPYIPEEIKMAQCEQALYLLNLDETVVANSLMGLRSENINVGAVIVDQSYSSGGTLYSPIAKSFVTPYLLKTSTRIQRA